MTVSTVRAGVLDVAFERHGRRSGWPVVLLHGFPYDVRCYDGVVGPLVAAGADVVVPYLRGFGATSFVEASTPRSGQQAALAHDLLELLHALELAAPIVAGFDWGGRAACLVSAVWPERVGGLVTVSGYNVQNLARAGIPAPPDVERRLWYQYYLHGERGRAGLAAHRAAFARTLWQEWSPTWQFGEGAFEATATSFDNPDFVEVVVHSYRHRFGLAEGDPAYQATEDLLAAQPPITVPTLVIDPVDDPLATRWSPGADGKRFPGLLGVREAAAGHNVPQQSPATFVGAVLEVHADEADRSPR